jgi:hypothetical protein
MGVAGLHGANAVAVVWNVCKAFRAPSYGHGLPSCRGALLVGPGQPLPSQLTLHIWMLDVCRALGQALPHI